MKTIKAALVVPAKPAIPESTIEVTNYGCDECDFVSRVSADVLEHFGEKHAVRDRIVFRGVDALKFNTEADARLWLSRDCSRGVRMDWEGPGWYVCKEYSEPCGHGCCDREISELVPIKTFLYDLQEEGRAKLRVYFHIRNELRKREDEPKNV